MLAALTTDALVLIDPPTLKKAPTSIPTTCSFSSQPTACAWAPDNSCLFVSLGNTIEKYDPNGTLLDTIYSGPSPLTALVSKDKGNTLILGAGTQVIVLETQTGKVPQSFKSHKLPVLALSLSNDSSLLASISVSTVHVHNLSLASHTVLRGLPSGEVTACAFHPHTRTRLLLGIGLQLAIYDTTRPSGPSKTIIIEKGAGQIVAIACSPFSKTLVAVAYSGGNVSLVDLEKDKGLFRTLSLHVPLTSLVFSPEGAALYAGTENGNVLTLDLRALDKPPKTISVSEDCQKVVYMAIQKKLKSGEGPSKSATSAVATKTQFEASKLTSRRAVPSTSTSSDKRTSSSSVLSKPRPSPSPLTRSRTLPSVSSPSKMRVSNSTSVTSPGPVRSRTVSATSAATSPSSRFTSSRATSATSRTTVSVSPPVRKVGSTTRNAFSPPKSPLAQSASSEEDRLDVSVRVENLLNLPRSKRRPLRENEDQDYISNTLSTASRVSARQTTRTRTVSTASARSSASRVPSGSGLAPSANIVPSASGSGRTKKPSSAATSVARAIGPRSGSPVPTRPHEFEDDEQLTTIRLSVSRSPSPEQPLPLRDGPSTLMPVNRKGKSMDKGKGKETLGVLGLGTPEVRRWVDAGDLDREEDTLEGRREGRRVGFAEPEPEALNEIQIQSIEVLRSGKDQDRLAPSGETEEATIKMRVQISPRRPALGSSNLAPAHHTSPLRNLNFSQSGTGAGDGHTATNPAHDLLHTLIKDALYDFRRETKSEIIGLHLDLVRMGRGWKKEMREAMDQWSSDLKEVREENTRLRGENERLRRGY